jgi:hypothetical protein
VSVFLTLAAIVIGVPTAAQTTAVPAGHWRGSINVPDNAVPIELDIARDAKGGWLGTFTSSDVKGLPLGNVTVDGRAVKLVAKLGQYSGTFNGVLSENGLALTGTYDTADGSYSIPFAVDRTGEAIIEPAPKNPKVTARLEGSWQGSLDVSGAPRRLLLKIQNQPDGTSSATINSLDAAGIDVPVRLSQQDSTVTIEIGVSSSRFVGTLGTDIVGAFSQGGATLPLTFKRLKP